MGYQINVICVMLGPLIRAATQETDKVLSQLTSVDDTRTVAVACDFELVKAG